MRYIAVFDRKDMPMAVTEGTIVRMREVVGQIMSEPAKVDGKMCYLSSAKVYEFSDRNEITDNLIGEYRMGVLDGERVGIWQDPKGRYYLLKKNGTTMYDIDKGVADVIHRAEMNTRGARIRTKKR